MTSSLEHAATEPRGPAPRSKFPVPSAVRLGSLPENSEQELRFVQDRLALFGKVTFFISGMFLVVTVVADVLRQVHRMEPLGRASHVAGTLIGLGLWLALRGRKPYSHDALAWMDGAGSIAISLAFVGMGYWSLQPYGFYTALLSITHVSMTRAIVMPSRPSRMLLLGAASFAGLVWIRAALPLPPDLVQFGKGRGIMEALLWSTAGVAVSTVASRVIYGLEAKAREALQLGQYSLEEKIGEGGMGEIYRARHAMLRRPTAVKLLLGGGGEEQLRRFEREVQLTARLTHPNTISIYDYGRTPDGVFYYAMELLEGLTLDQLVERHGPLPPGRLIHLLIQVCGALNEAHHIGLIHRDIKPANIFVCRRGEIADFVKVLDFGLVRELKNDGETEKSNVNAVVGTPLYLSPEAILSPSAVDARADLYGLGGVAYFLATGTPPFSGASVVELCAHHLHSVPPPPSARKPLPADLERLILACLAKKPEDRPSSARALAEALERCEDAGSWSAREAEAWWSARITPSTLPKPSEATSGEQLRRTLVAADLDSRLANEAKRSA